MDAAGWEGSGVVAATTGSAGRWPAARGWLGVLARVLLAGTFFWAGLSKIGDPAASVRAVRAYRVLPEWLAKAVGYGLPFVEVALAVLLLVGIANRLSAIVGAALLAVFVAGMVSAWARGLRIDCGCFGGGGDLTAGASTHYPVEVLRDVGLLLAAVFLVRWPRTPVSADEAVRRSVPGVDMRVGPRRTRAAQERLAALTAQRESQIAWRTGLVTVVAGIVLVAAAGTGVAVQASRQQLPPGPTPQAVSTSDGVVLGKAGAKVTIDLYEDMQCPVCQQFEASAGSVVRNAIAGGNVRVRYHVISFLNDRSTNLYSSRAANAAYCAADASQFQAYHDYLYQNQPAENSAGPSDDELVAAGAKVGITNPAFGTCVKSGKYNSFVADITDYSSKQGINGTPTILVNDTQVTTFTGAALQQAISQALGA
jgi:protein-disulfide isomerase